MKSVAIIIRVMDRADELRVSLPSLLSQDYPSYHVVVVDHSSQDGLRAVLEDAKSPRLRVVRCPRPAFFNPSSSGNTGARYSFSDLLFFLDTGMRFRDAHHLSEIVNAFERSDEIDDRHYERWRQRVGCPALEESRSVVEDPARRVYCECECHGLHTLVSRDIFQRIGGLNDALLDWGYEDTDLTTRLELCGYGRIPIRELVESKHSDDLRVRFFEVKSKERSWTKNRIISDGFIRTFGPVLRTQRTPGLCDWVEIDGVTYRGADAPQQDWTMQTVGELPTRPHRPSLHTPAREKAPLVSVVVPTKNAAEYLVVVLDSILSQDYPNIECLVADGGSTDATLDILGSYGDRIAWTSQPDRGAFDAINRAWQTSRGQFLAWLNADDSWAPEAVSAAVKCFTDDPAADVVYGDCLIVDADGRELERRRPPDWDLAYAVENCHHMIDQPAAFIRRDIAERVGWLYPAWFHDWELWRRVTLAGGRIKRVPYLLGCQRVRRDNSQYRPEILVGGLVGLTKRFFSLPGVPAEVHSLQRRALSNCYLKIVQTLQYGRPESRGLRLKLCLKALAADPSNLLNILHTTPRGRRPLPMNSPQTSTVYDVDQPTSPEPGLNVSSRPESQPELQSVVSVVVPCKNDARYLPAALESILSQDYPHLECIVVDGGSSDGTLDILKRYGHRIRWLSEPDRGAFDAINRGWQLSKGKILTWLNADDLWAPGAVRTAVEVFERKPEVDVVFGTAAVVDELGQFQGDLVPRAWDLEHALRHCDHIIFQPASFMRRRILEHVGWLYPAWCHDHDLWLRIARAGGALEKIPARLGMDRMRPENLGRLARLVIPAKIGLTERFFAESSLPPELQRLRQRAMSSAYVRAVDYLKITRPRDWLTATRLLGQALAEDPLNIAPITERATRPFRWHTRHLSRKVSVAVWTLATEICRSLFHLLTLPFAAPKRRMGQVLERVFVRGNREQSLKIDSLQRRVASAEQTLTTVAHRIDRIGTDVTKLVEELDTLRQHQREQLAALSRVPHDVYGTPPTLRQIPGWHTYWGLDSPTDRFFAERARLWSSLKRPVAMRWLADLLVMIWPGNELSRVLFLTGNFEPNELTWLTRTLTSGMTVIDLGAHIGLHTMVASKLVGDSGVVVAIEPSTREFQRLAVHVALNDLTNVRCLQVAASDSSGEAPLKIAWEWNSGHNTLGDFFDSGVEIQRAELVPTKTVDSVVAEQKLQRVDVMKIDVEGHEAKVLAGAVETITRFRPRILIEIFEETLRRQGASVEEVLAVLEAHGYDLYEFSAVSGDLVPLKRPVGGASRNLVAIPQ